MNKKPKTLYEYDVRHQLQKHKITQGCLPVPVDTEHYHSRWRCRTRSHDFHGWDNMRDAKAAELLQTTKEISDLQAHRDKIFKSMKEKNERQRDKTCQDMA